MRLPEPSRSVRAHDPINITCIGQSEREAMCINCALPDCVGLESEECPIRVEERRRHREKNARRNQRRPRKRLIPCKD